MWILILFLVAYFSLAYIPFLFRGKGGNIKPSSFFYSPKEVSEMVALLEDPKEAGMMRLELIRKAKETIDISYHTFSEGVYSSLFVMELINAAERGVKIRFLNDGIVGGFSSSAKRTAKALSSYSNITIALYEPFNLNPYSWNNRLHDKYLLVDGQRLITGGRNISDKTFMPVDFKGNVVFDRDILVAGEKGKGVIKEVEEYIDMLWSSPYVKKMKQHKRDERYIGKLIEEGTRNKVLHPEFFKHPDVVHFFSTDGIHIVSNPIKRGSKKPVIWNELLELMKTSDGDIIIQSPYIVLFDTQIKELMTLGKDITFYTNSSDSTPNLPAFPHYLPKRNNLDVFSDIFEYVGKGSVHTKTYVIGDELSVIASFNLDPRSLHLDTETAYVIRSKEFNEYLRELYKELEKESIHVLDGDMIHPAGYKETVFVKVKKCLLWLRSILFLPMKPLV